MKKTLTMAGGLLCVAALTLTSCAQAPGTGLVGSSQCSRERQCQRVRCRFQGLHGFRLGRF